jgi:hypothetical protein
LLSLEKVDNKGLGNRIQGTGMLDLTPVSWLTFRSSFGVDLDFYKNTAYRYAYSNEGINNVFLTPGGNQRVDASELKM